MPTTNTTALEALVRRCFKCKCEKHLDDFPRNKYKALGRLHICRQCKADMDRINRARSGYYKAKQPSKSKLQSIVRSAVCKAVKSGSLIKLPCLVCGSTRVEAHHPAYSLPLDVVWLCPEHHHQVHLEHKQYAKQ